MGLRLAVGPAPARKGLRMAGKLRFGIQTILWGPFPGRPEPILRFIRDVGLTGVEVFQHPRQLGDPAAFRAALEAHGLTLTGLCSGTLDERIDFCSKAGLRPEYLYIDRWDEGVRGALDRGYTVAMHPHVFKSRSLAHAFEVLGTDDRLKLILDPAHLYIGGFDPVKALDEHYDRLFAVHVKDWGPWFGRSFHRYAKGFTELGNGDVPLVAFLEKLKAKGFAGWAILEQDTWTCSAERSVEKSLQWLADQGYVPAPKTKPAAEPAVPAPRELALRPETVALIDSLVRAPETPELFPRIVTQGFAKWADCRLVRQWSYCPAQDALTLIGSHPPTSSKMLLDVNTSHSGKAIQRHRITYTPDIRADDGPRNFQDHDLIAQFGLRAMLTVPVFNRYNPNHVELLLNLFPQTEIGRTHRAELGVLSEYIALAAERIVADRCTRVTGAVQKLFTESTTKEALLKAALPLILEAVEGEAASIFLENPVLDRLEVVATTGVEWDTHLPPDRRHYERGQWMPGVVWYENIECFALGADRTGGPEVSQDQTAGPARSVLCVPIRDYSGQAIGVIRCTNKRPQEGSVQGRSFSQEDATVLQSIGDALLPRLLLLRRDEHVRLMLAKLTHELKTPIVGVDAQLDFIEAEASDVRFSEDWIKEARDNTRLMSLLVENAEAMIRSMIRVAAPVTPEEPSVRVYLMRDIVAPVVDQMSAQLRRHGLPKPKQCIFYDDFQRIPPLWVKAGAIRQVFYNLLSNAIKYRYRDPSAFRVEIHSDEDPSSYLVHFCNYGPGVDPKDAERIFAMGVRGSDSYKYDVTGQGFGLSISRQILREHGGDLELTGLTMPTVFTLRFPRRLARRP